MNIIKKYYNSFEKNSPHKNLDITPSMANQNLDLNLFPQEILTEILLKLPSKTLKRFTLVSKSWRSLITSQSFITSYNNLHSQNPKLLFLKHPHPLLLLPSSIHFSISSDSSLTHELSTFNVPQIQEIEKIVPTRVELVTSNSINGVICVIVYLGSEKDGRLLGCDLWVMNPSSGESIKVPSSELTQLFCGPPMVKFYCGFGFDGYDYKVIRVVYNNNNSISPLIEVFSLREKSWRNLGAILIPRVVSPNILWASSESTFVDGVGYWGAFKRERKDKFFILGFDYEKECFKKVKVPFDCVDGCEMRYHSLWVYNGLLAISVLRFAEFESSVTRHYIWVMMIGEGLNCRGENQYHWFKVFNIDLEGGPRKPMVTLGNGEVLLIGEDDGEHALFDPQSEEVKTVDIFDVVSVVYYVESLVSLSNPNNKILGV